jgi:hypothetical protein
MRIVEGKYQYFVMDKVLDKATGEKVEKIAYVCYTRAKAIEYRRLAQGVNK